MYAELNTKSDYCECCGSDGEIQIKEDESGKLIWGMSKLVEIQIRIICLVGKTYLWIYRNTVLESGTYTGDQGSSPSFNKTR